VIEEGKGKRERDWMRRERREVRGEKEKGSH
jgi:hypothetical protein